MKAFVRIALFGGVCAVVVLTGCSKFKGSTRLDMGPFAENTTAMLAEAEQILQPLPYNHLREYQIQTRKDPVLQEDVEIVRGMFRGIGLYSLQVVSLNASRMKDTERAEKLADYFGEILKPILDEGAEDKLGLTRGGIDSTLTRVRYSKTFMEAINAADPMVYAIVDFAIQAVDRVGQVGAPAFERARLDVMARYAETRREVAMLDSLEAADVRTYIALQDYRAGTSPRESVITFDPLLAGVLKGRNAVEEYEGAQALLRSRLAATDATRAQLGVRIQEYNDKMNEVIDLDAELQRRVRAARLMFVYWLRAHRNLAQGVQVPPAIDIGGMVGSSAKKAAGAIVP